MVMSCSGPSQVGTTEFVDNRVLRGDRRVPEQPIEEELIGRPERGALRVVPERAALDDEVA